MKIMKRLIVSIIAISATASMLNAHCGTCSLDEADHGEHAAHKSDLSKQELDTYFSIQEALAGAAAQHGHELREATAA